MKSWMFLLMLVRCAWGDSWTHLGGVPPGHDLVTARLQPKSIPVEFAGTLFPPTLSIDGNKVQLQSSKANLARGVHINGKQISILGKWGRFFWQTSANRFENASAHITLSDGKTQHVAQIQWDHCFLESPQQFEALVDDNAPLPLVTFKGTLKDQVQLKVNKGGVLQVGEDVEVEISVVEGTQLLIGSLVQEGEVRRRFTVPIEVHRERFNQSVPVFSLLEPENLERGLNEVKGFARPGDTIHWKDQLTQATQSGVFKISVNMIESQKQLKFKVQSKESTHEYEVKFECPSCETQLDQKPTEGFYVGMSSLFSSRIANIGQFSNATLGASLAYSNPTAPIDFRPGFIVGYNFDTDWAVELEYEFDAIDVAAKDVVRGLNVDLVSNHLIWLSTYWRFFSLFKMQVGLSFWYNKLSIYDTDTSDANFLPSAAGELQGYNFIASAFLGVSVSYWYSHGIELSAQLRYIPDFSSFYRSRPTHQVGLIVLSPIQLRLLL